VTGKKHQKESAYKKPASRSQTDWSRDWRTSEKQLQEKTERRRRDQEGKKRKKKGGGLVRTEEASVENNKETGQRKGKMWGAKLELGEGNLLRSRGRI